VRACILAFTLTNPVLDLTTPEGYEAELT